MPKFNPGSHYHIHALGVIAITYAGFQRSIDYLYAFHPRQQKLPDELIDLYYFNLSEDNLWLLKTPKGREKLVIFAPPPYRRGHDHNSFRPGFPAFVPCSQPRLPGA
jgi:hypothetical protein